MQRTHNFNTTCILNLDIEHDSHSYWKNGRAFSTRGKVREFFQVWKSQEILPKTLERSEKIILEFFLNNGKVREICQLLIVNTLQIRYHTLNIKKKTFKNTAKVGEICKSGKVGTLLKKKVIKLIGLPKEDPL